MNKYKIKIKLLSDACVSNGQSSGTNIDTDVCTNEFGFPYIPAKRIKGLLREAYNDYLDINNLKKDSLCRLFGTEGKDTGTLKFTDANLDDYNDFLDKTKDQAEETIVSFKKEYKYKIKNLYTTTRTQTAIDQNTGVAKDGSLRSLNVINKGLDFFFDIYSNENITELIDSLKLVRHMGINRNRGLGEIDVTLVEPVINFDVNNNDFFDSLNDVSPNEEVTLKVTFKNIQPLIIAGVDKTKTINYIPGSNIYGFYASKYPNKYKDDTDEYNEDFIRLFFKDGLKFSNAYITSSNEESIPVPQFIKRVKHENKLVNTLLEVSGNDNEPRKKLANLKNSYCTLNDFNNNNINIVNINFNYSYHHSRVEDKYSSENIGNVKELYEYFSISSNQKFIFNVTGKYKELKEMLMDKYIYLGKAKNSEYGMCEILNIDLAKPDGFEKTQKFVFYFKSDALLVDENGSYALSIKDVKNIIVNHFKKDDSKIDLEVSKYNINFTRVGGYNAKWDLNKPQRTAIEKGSYILFETTDNTNINIKTHGFIGEDTNIGFGEYRILKENLIEKEYKYNDVKIKEEINLNDLICDCKVMARLEAINNLDLLINDIYKNKEYSKYTNINNSQLGHILLMLLKSSNLENFKEQIDSKIPNGLLKQVDFKLAKELTKVNDVKLDDDINDLIKSHLSILNEWDIIKDNINKLMSKEISGLNHKFDSFMNEFNKNKQYNYDNLVTILKENVRKLNLKCRFVNIDYIVKLNEKYLDYKRTKDFKGKQKDCYLKYMDFYNSFIKNYNIELFDDYDSFVAEMSRITNGDSEIKTELESCKTKLDNLKPKFKFNVYNEKIKEAKASISRAMCELESNKNNDNRSKIKELKNINNNISEITNILSVYNREIKLISLYEKISEMCDELDKNTNKKLYVKYFKTFIKLIEWEC